MRATASERELLVRLSTRELPSRRELLCNRSAAAVHNYSGDKQRRGASARQWPRIIRVCLCGVLVALTCCCVAVAIVLQPWRFPHDLTIAVITGKVNGNAPRRRGLRWRRRVDQHDGSGGGGSGGGGGGDGNGGSGGGGGSRGRAPQAPK